MIHLLPNTTSATQPLDAGIIKNFKVKYRQLLLNYVIASNELSFDIEDNIKMISLNML